MFQHCSAQSDCNRLRSSDGDFNFYAILAVDLVQPKGLFLLVENYRMACASLSSYPLKLGRLQHNPTGFCLAGFLLISLPKGLFTSFGALAALLQMVTATTLTTTQAMSSIYPVTSVGASPEFSVSASLKLAQVSFLVQCYLFPMLISLGKAYGSCYTDKKP